MAFVEEARRRSVGRREPLVLFTTSANGYAPAELAVLRKPFRSEQLAQLVDALMGQAARRRANTTPPVGIPKHANRPPTVAPPETSRLPGSRSIPGDEPS